MTPTVSSRVGGSLQSASSRAQRARSLFSDSIYASACAYVCVCVSKKKRARHSTPSGRSTSDTEGAARCGRLGCDFFFFLSLSKIFWNLVLLPRQRALFDLEAVVFIDFQTTLFEKKRETNNFSRRLSQFIATF